MYQASFPPGWECSTSQEVEPRETRERVRTISQSEQEALEHAPSFGYFCAWLYRLAQAARAKREAPRPPEAA